MTWQYLIRDWLRRTAEARLREAMAAQEAERATIDGGRAAEVEPAAHVGVVMCEHRESVGLIDRLDGLLTIEAHCARVYEGGMHGRRLAVVVCENSAQAVADATDAMIDGHRPQWLLAAGFCTALVPSLAADDLFLASHVACSESTALPLAAPSSNKWQRAGLLSQSAPVREQAERTRLAEQFAAAAADRHAYWVADAAHKRNVACAALAVVRRAWDKQSPRDVDRLRRKQSLSRRIGLWTGIVLSRPGGLKKVWNENEADLIAADRLADGIATLVDQFKEGP